MITPSGGGAAVSATTAHYRLTADIALGYWQDDGDGIEGEGEIYDSSVGGKPYTESNWTPISKSRSSMFWGTFDGNGHTISGIYINTDADYQGLFGFLPAGDSVIIKNLGVVNSFIKGGEKVGGILGTGTIQNLNCYNTGTVISTGSRGVGGIFGTYNGASFEVSDCYYGGYLAGGIGGTSAKSCIQNCYNSGRVSGNTFGPIVAGTLAATIRCYYDKQICDNGVGNKYNDGLGICVCSTRISCGNRHCYRG